MRAEALLLLALAAAPAGAQDEGHPVRWKGEEALSFSAAAPGPSRTLAETPASDPIPEPWDTVLVQGYLPEGASLRLQAGRGEPARWRTLELHRFPSGRFWAKAVLEKAAGPVRLRAVSAAASAPSSAAEVFGVVVFASDPLAPPPPAVPFRGPRSSSVPRPAIIPRSGPGGWNAAKPAEPWQPDPLPWRVTLHHAATRAPESLEDTLEMARYIQDFHMRGRGWNDIGYHFLVDPAGRVLEGRPEGALGAHTLRNNEGNIGIVLLGDHHRAGGDSPTPEQLSAVAGLGRYLVRRYGLSPDSLKGHRDYKLTECPGDRGYAAVAELRRAFAEAAASRTLALLRETRP